jgi:predicted MFS family arabinose efflux permease
MPQTISSPDSARRQAEMPSGTTPAASWISLLLLTITYSIYTLDRYIVAVVIEPLKTEFALSDSQVGMITGLASTLPFLVTCIPIGMLADRVNRKWLLIGLTVLWSASTGLAGFATSVTFLVVSRVLVGAFEAGFTPLSLSILGDRFPPQRRSSAIGLFNIGPQVGVFLGLAVGGLVVAAYGWRWAFFIAGIPGIVMGVVLALVERDPPRGAFDTDEDASSRAAPRARVTDAFVAVWRSPIALFAGICVVLCSALPAAIGTWAPSFFIRVHGFSVAEAGFAAAAIGLVTGLGAGCGGFVADWLGRRGESRRLLAPIFGCSVAVVLGLIGLLFTSNGLVAVVLLAIMGLFNSFYAGVGYAHVIGFVSPWVRSTVVAIVLVTTNVLASGLGTMLVGVVSDIAAPAAGMMAISYGLASSLIFNVLGVIVFVVIMQLVRRARG